MLFSVCVSGRNDNYCGNFKYRLESSLNLTARNIIRLGLEGRGEIVVCDWNSDTPLRESLRLNEEARKVCRFVEVLPEVASHYRAGKSPFNSAVSVNVAFRRAAGEYLVQVPGDVFFPLHSLKALSDLLSKDLPCGFSPKDSLMVVRRKMFPWQYTDDEPTIDEIERFLIHSFDLLEIGDHFPGLNAGMGSVIMSRHLCEEIEGLDESLVGWGYSDIEQGLRLNNRYPLVPLSYYGIYSIELDSKPTVRQAGTQGNMNPYWVVPRSLNRNQPNWGLNGIDLPEASAPRVDCFQPSLAATEQAAKSECFLRDRLVENSELFPVLNKYRGSLVDDNTGVLAVLVASVVVVGRPLCLLEYGCGKDILPLLVAELQPHIHIVAVNDWKENEPRLLPFTFTLSRSLVEYSSFRGRLQFLTGELGNSHRLAMQDCSGKIDLAILRADLFENPGLITVDVLTELNAVGSVLVVTSDAEEGYRSVLEALSSKIPQIEVVAIEVLKVCVVAVGAARSNLGPFVQGVISRWIEFRGEIVSERN